jgi:hypothetical protein
MTLGNARMVNIPAPREVSWLSLANGAQEDECLNNSA